jgi:penicillin amidase
MRIGRRWTWGIVAIAALAILPVGAVWLFLRASLPQLDGQVAGAGLLASVMVERDSLGVPTITAQNRADLAYATGYLHAQDRFFQMDLLRRSAAGELAALFGPVALPVDRFRRLHRFRARAQAALEKIPPADRALLDRYVAGVNAGLGALGARPFEYGVLRLHPEPWRAEDSLLVGWAMYFELQGNFGRKLGRAWLQARTTPEQLAFLLPRSSRWDAPIDAPAIAEPEPPIPATAPDWYGRRPQHAANSGTEDVSVGSNNWAVAGGRTEHGAAIVADDMHLGLQLPNIWYRAALLYRDEDGNPRRLVGVTLPGSPTLVAGSNGHVAWGFTNSYGDYLDVIELQRDPNDDARFRNGDDWASIERVEERIDIKGAPDEILPVYETPLGPVWQIGGKSYALHWLAHDPHALNYGLLDFERADDLTSLLAAANKAGMPAQNVIAGDSAGNIGWTIAGPLPNRRWQDADGFTYPSSDVRLGWQGVRAPSDAPRIVNPMSGQLWTANARQLAGPRYDRLGDGGADMGARATQVRDDLTKLGKTDEQGVYGIGLDDRALFLASWRDRALAALSDEAVEGHADRALFRRLLRENWTGHAGVDSVGYRLAHDYMYALYQELFGSLDEMLAAEFGESVNSMRGSNSRWPVVLGRLEDEKPQAWLPSGKKNWQEVDLAAIDRVIATLTKTGESLEKASWGARNSARIMHPFAKVFPVTRGLLAAPADPLPGDSNMPRVAGPGFGQSERMVVAPGHEELGIFNMPGGASGHPLSPYFLAGHDAWVQGLPTKLLPGPAQHTLTFVPM